MRRLTYSFALILGTAIVFTATDERPVAADDVHSYFESLVASAVHWKSYSLRNQAELEQHRHTRSAPAAVTYDPQNDAYPNRQDAAKVVIPPFVYRTTLAASVDATTTTMTFVAGPGAEPRSSLKIDDEVMTVETIKGGTATVLRGQHGTIARPHSVGASVGASTNSLPNQVWLPMGTEDGHRYLTTWDAWFGSETRLGTAGVPVWKTFQFRRDGNQGPAIWFEVRTRFDSAPSSNDVAIIDARAYSALGPNVTRDVPLSPRAGTFTIKPQTWVRYWMLLDQRASDWDRVSLWAADPTTGPVLIYDGMQIESLTSSGHSSVHSFQLEFNTSTDTLRPGRPPLVVYVRNVAILRDLANVTSVLQRPGAGGSLPPLTTLPAPAPPQNLRIIRTP